MFSPHKHRFTVKNERFEVRHVHPAQIVRYSRQRYVGGSEQIEFYCSGGIKEHADLPPREPPDQLIERHAKRRQKADTKRFFTARTIEQLIAGQGVRPIADISVLAGAIPDDDVDEFVADIYRNRRA